jgi:hypothetical protein
MVSEAVPSRVPSSMRVLTVGWSCRSARDRIHGSGLPTSVRSSPTGREGSAASTTADQVSPATLRRRWVCSSSSSSKTRIPSYSLRVRVRGQTSALVSLIGC